MTARTAHVIRSASHGAGLIIAALAVAAAILLASRAGIAGPPDGADSGAPESARLQLQERPSDQQVAALAAQDIKNLRVAGDEFRSTPAATPPAGPAIAVGPDSRQPSTAPQVDEVRHLWRRGEYVAAGILGLFLLLATAVRVDRRRALYYTAGLTALAGCVDLAANGQTPSSGMLIGAVVVFVGIVTRSPLPAASTNQILEPTKLVGRTPNERGSAAGPLLAILAGTALTIAAMSAWSCAGAKHAGTVVKDAVVDCSKLTAETHAAEYADRIERAVRAGTAPNGEVSWTPAKREIASILVDAGLDVAGCAAATAVARLLSFAPAPVGIVAAPEPSRARLLDGWQATRAEMFGGRRFAVAVEGM